MQLISEKINFQFVKMAIHWLTTKPAMSGNSTIFYKKGQTIPAPDTREEYLIVKKGKIKVFATSNAGYDKILGIFNPGTVLESFRKEIMISATTVALMDSEIFYLKYDQLMQYLNTCNLM